jgi:iron-sulfur cluster assembly accessory protein
MNPLFPKIVSITSDAAQEVRNLVQNDQRPQVGLRLGVKGGGCSGLSYVIDLDTPKEKDQIQQENGFQIYIDLKSSLYLKGSELFYNTGITDRGFKFRNPNAQNTCGCGESFAL